MLVIKVRSKNVRFYKAVQISVSVMCYKCGLLKPSFFLLLRLSGTRSKINGMSAFKIHLVAKSVDRAGRPES